MSTEALWYAARGTGTTCLLLLTLTVVLGIVARSGRGLAGLPGFAIGAVHRGASLLAVVLLAMHIGTLLLDPYAKLGIADVVLPFGAGYRPLWVGLGTVAADLLIAVVVTSLLRRRLGVRAWRAVHWAAYGAWPLALSHGLGSGTDAGTPWLRAVAMACALAVAGSAAWRCSPSFRILPRPHRPPSPRHQPAAPTTMTPRSEQT
ncbi:hypothetical protein ThrDRAFT_03379 [Frankia casuarinae]|uniref:Integral membrane protein n=1 Tax=Frankia casuarinae (strain DSM 45818 / CECT 9043 / HFP020203 / CcI3) TaxID=106370 RepID=Q2J9U4_FRACC|nr:MULTISPECIES: ferric reductase-like transmembrane domain-containing protein [Frankia]ABD11948.1 putative integral membrane protein [Frankia casuarinae]EYT90975.1 hypothetical protein ThrDRAFT_03379 [Frankia casuarinae]KEZ34979.1 Ferric reductase like transmembrane component [Frankia sp. CeD]